MINAQRYFIPGYGITVQTFNEWRFFSVSHQAFKSQRAVMEAIESFLTNGSRGDLPECWFSLIWLGIYEVIFWKKDAVWVDIIFGKYEKTGYSKPKTF